MTREISARDRSIASLIFGFLLACYLLTYTGFIQSSDGLAMFATVESMVRRGEVDSNQLLWMDVQQGSYGPDGELYSRKGLGMPLLALPLVWMANLWPALGLVQTALLLNPIVTAWTGALIFRTGRRLDWGRAASMVTGLVFGLATLAWPYTQTFFSDPVAAWGLFGAFYGMLGYRQTNRKRYLLLAGIAWGIAYLSRVINLVTLPVYLVLLVTVILRSVGRTLRPDFLNNLRALVVYNWRAFASFMLPVIGAGLASLWWNWLRYGTPWDSGYVEAESFSADWLLGISGLLIGPARGLIWYVPVLILAVPGAFWFWQEKRWLLIAVLSICVIFVSLYGKWFMWHGGFSWGPRFMVVLLPFLSLLTGPVFERLFGQQRLSQKSSRQTTSRRHEMPRMLLRSISKVLVSLLIFISVAVQWLGMLAPFRLVQEWLQETVQPLFAPETFTNLDYSPLLIQWRFIRDGAIPFGWWQNGNTAGIDWFGLLVSLAGILGGIILIIRQIKRDQNLDSSTINVGPELAVDNEAASDENGPRYWVYSTAVLLMTLTLLTHYRTSLANESMRVAAQIVEQGAHSEDAILHLRPTLTQEFANFYHGTLPTYGLFGRESLDEIDQTWLAHLHQNYRRLWVIAAPGLPESTGWERSLRTDDFLLDNGTLNSRILESRGGGDGGVQEKTIEQRVPLYGLFQPEAMVEHGVGAIFGSVKEGQTLTSENGEILLIGYAALPTTKPGAELLLTLRWESLKVVDNNYHVFVHVLAEDGDMIAQRDGQPVQWMRPISTWQAGDVIVDRYGLLLPDDVAPGKYRLSVGLYDPNSGERLPVNTGTIENAVELESFEILP